MERAEIPRVGSIGQGCWDALHIRNRIWDVLFTTTLRVNNSLGSGMGLGLGFVQQLVRQMDGRIEVADPPSGLAPVSGLTLAQSRERKEDWIPNMEKRLALFERGQPYRETPKDLDLSNRPGQKPSDS